MEATRRKSPLTLPQNTIRIIRIIAALLLLALIILRAIDVAAESQFGADTWLRLSVSGLIIGGMYALIAIGIHWYMVFCS